MGHVQCHSGLKRHFFPFTVLAYIIEYMNPKAFAKGSGIGAMVKNSPANARDKSSVPGLGKSSGVGNGNPLQHSCLENSMDSLMGCSPWGRRVGLD